MQKFRIENIERKKRAEFSYLNLLLLIIISAALEFESPLPYLCSCRAYKQCAMVNRRYLTLHLINDSENIDSLARGDTVYTMTLFATISGMLVSISVLRARAGIHINTRQKDASR